MSVTAGLTSIVVKPISKHNSTLIFMHGLGDSGDGWSEIGKNFGHQFPGLKWIFPNAPSRPITLNGGMRMPGWYDIRSLDKLSGDEDHEGIWQSAREINAIIEKELDAGIPNSRILIGGFSQGAAMAYSIVLSSPIKLGGCIALSGYLPLSGTFDKWRKDANKGTPYFVGHGDADPVVAYKFGKDSVDMLQGKSYKKVQFETYRNLGHSSSQQEMRDVTTFIASIL